MEKNIDDLNNTELVDEATKSSRRDFVVMSASAVAVVGAVVATIPFVKSLSPDAGVLASGTIDVEIGGIKEGETMTVMWRGKPIFITNRTKKQIEEARSVNLSELKDPEEDQNRVKKGKENWLITIGVCTHLGCVPLVNKGSFNGWFCPCHGSDYDSSARIRKGPAPKNLEIPPYNFLSDTKIRIG